MKGLTILPSGQNAVTGVLIAIGFLLLMGQAAFADSIPFSNTFDWSGSGTDGLITYAEIDAGNNSLFNLSYAHSFSFAQTAQSILSAQVSITHKKNSAGGGEWWILSAESGPVFLGDFTDSDDSWITDTFAIPPAFYPDSGATSWTLSLLLTENTAGRDKILLDKSVLSGMFENGIESLGPETIVTTDPIPEPTSLLLLGTGLSALGFVAYRRRRK